MGTPQERKKREVNNGGNKPTEQESNRQEGDLEGYSKSGNSPPNGKPDKSKPLKVLIRFIPVSDDEIQNRRNTIAEALLDSALRELRGKPR